MNALTNETEPAEKTISKAEVKQVTIELLAPHEHGGETYPTGTKLTVRSDQAKRLIDNKKAKEVRK